MIDLSDEENSLHDGKQVRVNFQTKGSLNRFGFNSNPGLTEKREKDLNLDPLGDHYEEVKSSESAKSHLTSGRDEKKGKPANSVTFFDYKQLKMTSFLVTQAKIIEKLLSNN